MIYIKFKNGASFMGSFRRVSEHIISITGGQLSEEGFSCYRDETEKKHLGDYYDYTTIYREETGELSNDGSHYIPPEPPPEPQPTYSDIYADGVKYSVVDFQSWGDIQFLLENFTVEEAENIFKDSKTIVANGVEYANLVFSSAFEVERYHKTYVEVNIHIKTETEILREDVDNTEENISGEYDSNRTYLIDEYCTYNGQLYRFTKNAGRGILPTNTLYWQACDIVTELNKLTTIIKEI